LFSLGIRVRLFVGGFLLVTSDRNPQNDGSLFDFLERALNTDVFEGVGGLAYTCGIDKAK